MSEQLRDIAPIEHSFFLLYIIIVLLIFSLLLYLLIRHLKKNKKENIDYWAEWKKLIDSSKIKKSFNDYKKFYYLLNQIFKNFISIYLDKNINGYTLNEILELLPISDDDKRNLTDSLERIYRGDYYFLESSGKSIMENDLKTIEIIVKKLGNNKIF